MKRSKFSLSHFKLLSCNMGSLVPCGMHEVLPGDTIQQATNALVRVSPLLAPIMHPVDVRIHHWFVPYRILWDDWENFITGGPDGNDASVFPTINLAAVEGDLSDYLGIPLGHNFDVSALPYRAYAMIFNEWYRDQDLQTELPISRAAGSDTTTNTTLQNCNWGKDYFTSSRPWEQKGPAITIPLGTTAPVNRVTNAAGWEAYDAGAETQPGTGESAGINSGTAGNFGREGVAEQWSLDPNGGLITDLSAASAVTVNVFREALALQRYEEARARFGSRYVEYLRYLGVQSSDARLQRPEYLGGGRETIQFSEVLATAEGTNTEVGDLKGHGITSMRSNRYRRYFEEHGVCLSFLSARPKSIYMQGLDRMWQRRNKEDFWQKELQHIGQQEVLNPEIYLPGPSPTGVFGYQDRYDEYRRQHSTVAGEFRTTLDFWHMARDFASAPALNETFVKCVPTDRIYAVSSSDQLQILAKHSVQARRLVAQTGSSFIY